MFYLVLDLEATCWDNDVYVKDSTQEIIEFGAYLINGYGEVLDHISEFVRPEINPTLSIYCKNLTHIEQKDVDHAETFDVFHDHLKSWLLSHGCDKPLSYVSWGAKDKELIDRSISYYQIDFPVFLDHIDFRMDYSRIKQLNHFIGQHKALKIEQIESEGQSHRALDDAYNLLKICLKHFGEW